MLACIALLGTAPTDRRSIFCIPVLAPWPDIYQVAMRALELLHPLLCVLLTGSSLLLIQGNKAFLNIRGHPAGITAHVDNRAFLNQLPDTVLLRLYRVLHVRLRLALKTRKCTLQLGYAFSGKLLELFFVDVILLRMAAAKVKRRWNDALPLRLGHCTLLQKPAEGCQARARGNHHHGRRGVLRRHEGRAGGTHEALDHDANRLLGEVGRADPLIPAPARARWPIYYPDRDAALVWIHQRRGGDRVVARLQRWQKLKVDVKRQLA